MKLYNLGSKRSFVNLFADFILTYLNPTEYLTQIEVADCVNFLVIGGKTEFKKIQDLSELKIKFAEKYKKFFPNIKIEKLNLIDLIEYDKKPDSFECLTFGRFYKSDRPIYHINQIDFNLKDFSYTDYDDSLKIYTNSCLGVLNNNVHYECNYVTSEFPHGYSIKNNRNKLYYSEYVAYNLFSIVGISKLNLNWINNSINLTSDSFINNDYINSMMLDVFDFDLDFFNKKIENYDILKDIIEPKETKNWLVKDKVSELFIT
jgi:hypothetical protein